ncbi:MAG: glycosyltransferase family 2 protein [Verrucomicrobiota bacterium]
MILSEITPLILTKNEIANIERTLAGLKWANRIVVIDSESTDGTYELLQSYSHVDVYRRRFDSHSEQWNYGLEKVETEWVLTLDADYGVPPELAQEIEDLPVCPDQNGFRIPFRYCLDGHPLRSSILPPRIALFRCSKGNYIQDGHTQDLLLGGECGTLSSPLLHDDRKPFSRWWASQQRYASLEVDKLRKSNWRDLAPQDRLRRMIIPAPFVVLIYALCFKGLILEGIPGWKYSLQRFLAEVVLSCHLVKGS